MDHKHSTGFLPHGYDGILASGVAAPGGPPTAPTASSVSTAASSTAKCSQYMQIVFNMKADHSWRPPVPPGHTAFSWAGDDTQPAPRDLHNLVHANPHAEEERKNKHPDADEAPVRRKKENNVEKKADEAPVRRKKENVEKKSDEKIRSKRH